MNYTKFWAVILTVKRPVKNHLNFTWQRYGLSEFTVNNKNLKDSKFKLTENIHLFEKFETKRKADNAKKRLLAAGFMNPELTKLFPVLNDIVGGVVEEVIVRIPEPEIFES